MFTQFFGNYLLNADLVSLENLSSALQEQKNTRLKLGVLAINAGFMTAEQVELVHEKQQSVDKRIGDLMVEMGFVTREQIEELYATQPRGYLLLGQTLVDNGYMTNAQFETALNDYRSGNYMGDDDNAEISASKLVSKFYSFDNEKSATYISSYITLLLKNLIRFIGEDFTPLEARYINNDHFENAIGQRICGDLSAISFIEGEDFSLVEFASRFACETLTKNDDYTKACISEFLNLHNGLFAVNMSNEHSLELALEPQQLFENITNDELHNAFLVPLRFSFGTINIIIKM